MNRVPSAGADPEATLDLAEIWRAVRQGWLLVVARFAAGLALGALVLLFWPRSFEGRASVLLRSASDGGTSFLLRVSVPSEVTSGLLGAAVKSPLETEMQLMQSRAILADVGDSLGLQVRVVAPAGIPSWRVVVPAHYSGAFKKKRYEFTAVKREAQARSEKRKSYDVSGDGFTATAFAGDTVRLPVGTIRLRDSLPDAFRIEIVDREDLLKKLVKRLVRRGSILREFQRR